MSSIWIVHRDAAARAALTRLAAAPEETVLGAPGDPIFDVATGATAVVLGIAGDDLELELEFAHRCVPRLPGCRWIVVSDGLDAAPLGHLFRGVALSVLRWPPHPDELRAALARSSAQRSEESLSERSRRDRLQMRFARWFADLDLPQLLRAVDPTNAGVPLLVRGERGTGRELAARYVHRFSAPPTRRSVEHPRRVAGTAPGPFVALRCTPETSEADLLSAITALVDGAPERCTLWYDELELLPVATQRQLQAWLEYGVPSDRLLGTQIRHAASVQDGAPHSRPALAPGLLAAFGGLAIRIPPLRERADAIEAIATDLLRSAVPDGERVRSIAPSALRVLREHPWPENLREFEAVLLRTVAATDADPIASRHLCFEAVLPEANGGLRVDDDGEPASNGSAALEPGTRDVGGTIAEDGSDAEVTAITDEHWDELGSDAPHEPVYLEEDGEDGDDDGADEWILDPYEEAVDQTFALANALDEDGGRPAADAADSEASPATQRGWMRLVRGLTHELRNPLVSARTLAELLPEQHADAEFRERMSDLVGADVRRVEALIDRLERIVGGAPLAPEEVDLSDLFAALLEARRERIQQRRLLVLRELERTQPIAIADPLRLRATIEILLDLALDRVQERGDVYVATHHNPQGLDGRPCVRLLIRFSRAVHASAGGASPTLSELADASQAMRDASQDDNSFDLALAEIAIASMNGRFALDASRASETVVVADLPAPATDLLP